RLTENEKLKAATKTHMAGTEKELESKKPPLQKAAETARAHKARLQQIENAHAKFSVDGRKLAEKVQQQRDREHHFEGELHLLETRFAEVDGKFNFIRETLAEVAGHGGAEAISLLTSGRESLAEKLQGEMMALNKEMARMMYIKGVKDAGGEISQGAQEAIMGRMEQREKLPSSLLPIKKVVVADDGSPSGRNLKRVFAQVASAYFKLSEGALEEISLKRLESRAEDPEPPPYPFVVLLADANGGDFGELKNLVKKIRAKMPETYQMVFAPFGEIWNLDPSQDRYKNLQVLKENSCLVNAAIADYTDPQSMARLLSEKAPRK
ncbi:MAG: hypothetical protein V3S29_07005, partial [bacterium]